MNKRYVSIWFRALKTDWYIRRQPELKDIAFVLTLTDHGRKLVSAANRLSQLQGVDAGIVLADARALVPSLTVFDDDLTLAPQLLKALAIWCIRYTPVVAIDFPDGLLLDVSGCTHLWGSEENYLSAISTRLQNFGYNIRVAMADTIGAAWALARYGIDKTIIKPGEQFTALLSLPPCSLRLEAATVELLEKLGLYQTRNFISLARTALRRRFGAHLLRQIDLALGNETENIEPVLPIVEYQERLPCLEPIVTATGIEIALKRLLEDLCKRLKREEKGLRSVNLKCYRVDGHIQIIEAGTLRPSNNSSHLFKLLENKIAGIAPALGIELFMLEALIVEDLPVVQVQLFNNKPGLDDNCLGELLDRIAGKVGANHIHRYVPDEHYWPERSYKPALSLDEIVQTKWRNSHPRPLQLLSKPVLIEVTAPIPDYPPMMFRYKGVIHKIIKADGPERIEQEWWLQQGQHRDYYNVEDEGGQRYWLFRSGHYDAAKTYQWFIHGFFA